jgi:hypothetical protein
MVYFAKNDAITIANKANLSFKAKLTNSFYDKTKPLAGYMGI